MMFHDVLMGSLGVVCMYVSCNAGLPGSERLQCTFTKKLTLRYQDAVDRLQAERLLRY